MPSNFGISSGIWSHASQRLLYTTACGENQPWSLAHPTAIPITPGRPELRAKSRLPQLGQKWRVLTLLLAGLLVGRNVSA